MLRPPMRPVVRPVLRDVMSPSHISDSIKYALFSSGEQGAYYDLYDSSTLFQDAAGTTPWTTYGQPLGLQRDKSKGLVRSANLVTNGDFASATGWTAGAGWAIGSGVATATTSSADLSTDIGAVATRWYVVTFTVTRTAGSLTVIASGTATTTPTISASGTYTLYILAAGAGSTLIFRGSGFSGTIDNVSAVYEQGNHRYQTTSSSRPTIEARVNLCTKSEFPGGTADSSIKGGLIAGVSLPNWLGRFTTGISFGHDGSTTSYVYMGSALASAQHTISVFVKMDDGNAPSFKNASANNVANDFVLIVSGSTVSPLTYAVTSVGDGVYRVSATITSGAASLGNNGVGKYNANSSRTFKVTGYQLELGSVATTYQRVNTATDYADIGAPPRIKYDGIDDFLQTAAVDFSATDKMTVWAGVRKLSDAAAACCMELSANVNSNNGAFSLFAPASAASNIQFISKGTAGATSTILTSAAPVSLVVTGTGDISADISKMRINGAEQTPVTTNQGTGNFGNYPLYFGARAGTSFRFSGEVFSPEVIRGAASTAAQIDMVERIINRNAGGIY